MLSGVCGELAAVLVLEVGVGCGPTVCYGTNCRLSRLMSVLVLVM